MKIVYIAHPIGGDPEKNVKRILKIVRRINLLEPETVPFAPYMADVLALDDNIIAERERGIKNDNHIFRSGIIDELRLYGTIISKGMRAEIELANSLNIPVVPFTEETLKLF
jgi:hypothetical protein